MSVIDLTTSPRRDPPSISSLSRSQMMTQQWASLGVSWWAGECILVGWRLRRGIGLAFWHMLQNCTPNRLPYFPPPPRGPVCPNSHLACTSLFPFGPSCQQSFVSLKSASRWDSAANRALCGPEGSRELLSTSQKLRVGKPFWDYPVQPAHCWDGETEVQWGDRTSSECLVREGQPGTRTLISSLGLEDKHLDGLCRFIFLWEVVEYDVGEHGLQSQMAWSQIPAVKAV